MIFPILIFPPNPQVFSLMKHEMSRKYTIIDKSLTYINKKNHYLTFPFLLFPSFLICYSLPIFNFFPSNIPPLAIVFCKIYTPVFLTLPLLISCDFQSISTRPSIFESYHHQLGVHFKGPQSKLAFLGLDKFSPDK